MRRPLIALAFAALLATSAAQAADDDEKTTTTPAMLSKLLEKEKLTFQQDEDRLRRTYSFTDGRSQQVFLQPQSDMREVGIVEVYSWVMEVKGNLTPALAKRLLEVNGEQKLGYFGIEEVDGKTYVFCYHNLPTEGLTSKALAATLISVAEMADEMEKEQLGASSDEY
ncbi:MAG TPA: YbjN domain-containing protein [Thermoanaerobaculia bacterium]|nr:YbjN domain-containing protein [Thermoanaerobaculia bacterium]